jgi:phage terminase large subunit
VTSAPSDAARRALAWQDGPYGVPVQPVVVHGSRVVYALQPRQLDVWRLTPLYRDPAKVVQPTHIGYGGAAGGGKSHLARAVAAGVALRWPGSSTIIFRRTRPELLSNHVIPFGREVPAELAVWRGSENAYVWGNGSRTFMGYLEKEKDVERYQGSAYDCMIFEESTHYAWSWVNWLVANRLRASIAGSTPFALYPSNPGGVGHAWFKRLFVDRKFRPDLEEDPEKHVFVQAFLHHNEILRRRDPGYEAKLRQQPEPYRSWYLFGDWASGIGLAVPQLDRRIHVIQPFEVPAHWPWFGGFDWGFAHPWVFGLYVTSEDGRVFAVDRIHGRRQTDGEIVQVIHETAKARGFDLAKLSYVAAGRDIFHKRGRDVGYDGPTLAERMIGAGLPVIEANNARIDGLRQMREFLAWQGVGPDGGDDDPFCYIMDTPDNRVLLDCLETIVTDPIRPEDALKQDANEFGEGGDDDYDEFRYALSSRPAVARQLAVEQQITAWSGHVLRAESERLRRVKDRALEPRGLSEQMTRYLEG